MRILELFERRTDVVEMMLFSYAVAVASLVCLHMPIVAYGATVLLLLALCVFAYGLWWLAQPASRRDALFYALALFGIVLTAGLLSIFSGEIAEFSVVQLHNSVTEANLQAYERTLLLLLATHSVVSAGTTYALYLLFTLEKPGIVRLFLMQWLTLPALFLFMKLYGLFLPLI